MSLLCTAGKETWLTHWLFHYYFFHESSFNTLIVDLYKQHEQQQCHKLHNVLNSVHNGDKYFLICALNETGLLFHCPDAADHREDVGKRSIEWDPMGWLA